jgi:hypothetical protein
VADFVQKNFEKSFDSRIFASKPLGTTHATQALDMPQKHENQGGLSGSGETAR